MRRGHLDFMAQLKGIANNVNQLTRLANAVGLENIGDRHDKIIGEIENLLKQLRDDR